MMENTAPHVLFVYLSSPEMAMARVKARVEAGGHDVPASTIERRYHRGLANFFGLYLPLANTWTMYNNSVGQVPTLVASGGIGLKVDLGDAGLWRQLEIRYGKPNQ